VNTVSGTCSIQASRKDYDDSSSFKIFLGVDLLPEVDFEGLVNDKSQSKRAVFPLGQLQPVLEPPPRRAVEEASDLAGRQHRRRVPVGDHSVIRRWQFRDRYFRRHDQFGGSALRQVSQERQIERSREDLLH
jgi:hypothetical protein